MTTITTKELRENMAEVIKELKLGKPVQISYRQKVVGVLQPVEGESKPLRRGSPAAILQALQTKEARALAESYTPTKSFKEEIRDLRERDFDL